MIDRRIVSAAVVGLFALAACRGSSSSLPQVSGSGAMLRSAGAPGGAVNVDPGFTSVGPQGPGKVNAVAIDPTNSKNVYVASGRGTGLETYSSAGIFKMVGKYQWVPIDNGLTDPTGAISSVVNALWLDPKNPSTLLAATEYDGLFRTTDGGSSWHSVYRTTQATQIVSYAGALYATSAAGILTSTDGGVHWSVQWKASPSRQPTAFGVAQGSGGNAFYAGMNDGTIYAFATSWAQVGKLPFVADTGTDGSSPQVHQIAVDPLVPTTLYANQNDGPWDQNLHASTDGGHTWNTVLTNKQVYADGLGTQAIAFSAVHPHMLYIGSDGWLYWIAGNGASSSTVHGAAHVQVIDKRDILVVPNGSDDACYLMTDQGLDYVAECSNSKDGYKDSWIGIGSSSFLARRFVVSPNMRTMVTSLQDWDSVGTTKGAIGWRFVRQGLYEDGFNELRPGTPAICYAYDEAYGLRVSTDNCVNYAKANAQQAKILPSRLMTTTIAFAPTNPLQMYVVSGDVVGAGFAPAPKAVFESTDGGKTLVQQPWPLTQPGAIWVDQTNGSHIMVGDKNKAGSLLRVTFNGGKTWTTSSGVPVTQFWYAITMSPANGSIVLASSVDSANNVFVLRSTDGGRTFRRVANVVNAPLIRGRIDVDDLLRKRGVALDEAEDAGPPQAFIYSPEREIRYNQDVTTRTPAVAITTLRGAFISTDNGTTWQRLDAKLIAHSFWGIRWVNGYLFLGSDGQGLVRSNFIVQKP